MTKGMHTSALFAAESRLRIQSSHRRVHSSPVSFQSISLVVGELAYCISLLSHVKAHGDDQRAGLLHSWRHDSNRTCLPITTEMLWNESGLHKVLDAAVALRQRPT